MAGSTPPQLFAALAAKFGWEDKVRDWMTDAKGLGAATLLDFLHAATTVEDVAAMVTADKADNKFLMKSRLRQAWLSLKQASEEQERIKRKGLDESDLDQLLTQPELDDMEARHWARYKMIWPPEIAPSDLLLSRLVRELGKRLLSVKEVLKVKTQAQQQRMSRKRTKMGDGIELIMGETMGEDSPRDVHSYLAGLQTLMIAYSKAGCETRQGAKQLEPKGTDSTRVVQCPLDVVMRYYYRVQDRAVKCGSLEWILSRDEADRAVWVDKYRNGADTLGEVIAQVMVMREAMWEVPLQRAVHQPKLQVEGQGAGKGNQGQRTRTGSWVQCQKPCATGPSFVLHFSRTSARTPTAEIDISAEW